MGLIEIASGNSVWRGMDYYNSSLSKAELQRLYLDALIEPEERPNRYW